MVVACALRCCIVASSLALATASALELFFRTFLCAHCTIGFAAGCRVCLLPAASPSGLSAAWVLRGASTCPPRCAGCLRAIGGHVRCPAPVPIGCEPVDAAVVLRHD